MTNSTGNFDPSVLLASIKKPSDFVGQKLFFQGDDWQNNAMLG